MQMQSVEKVMLDELTAWRVRGPRGELLVTAQGAQVLEYREYDRPPLIWLSDRARMREGQSVRGGIPVCWPWFGDLARNPEAVSAQYQGSDAPAHGLVRGLDWQLAEIESLGESVELRFVCDTTHLPGWSLAPELELRVCLDERLHLTLTNRNRSERTLTISQALHSYFAVSDVRKVSLEGFAGLEYIETLEDWAHRHQRGEPAIEGETDRIYLQTPDRLAILDPIWERRIVLESQGSRSTVLWNPWVAKAQRLSQFAADAWKDMLCIETANILEDVVELAPGAEHQLKLSLYSQPL